MPRTKHKQSLYFPLKMYHEVREEAERLDRPISWIIVQAWKLSKDKIKEIPGEPEDLKPKAP
jgi:uncharacterized small protein (TIGR04563 family)